jgi:hypothetical protein
MKHTTKGNIKMILIIIGAFLLIAMFLGSLYNDDSSNSYSDRGRYGRGYEYDRNVYDIAGAYGEDPDVVNDKINRVAEAMN